jgi:hypothetical protein
MSFRDLEVFLEDIDLERKVLDLAKSGMEAEEMFDLLLKGGYGSMEEIGTVMSSVNKSHKIEGWE